MTMHKGILGQTEGGASVKTECCGNPLRGCATCPPPKKLTFEEWWLKEPSYFKGQVDRVSARYIWLRAQENK